MIGKSTCGKLAYEFKTQRHYLLMQNLVERIARFADIDTRRAMGFLPRRLPPSDREGHL